MCDVLRLSHSRKLFHFGKSEVRSFDHITCEVLVYFKDAYIGY